MLNQAAHRQLRCWNMGLLLGLILSLAAGCGSKPKGAKSDSQTQAKAEKEKQEQAAKKKLEEEAKAKAAAAAKKKADADAALAKKNSLIATAPPKDKKRSEGFSTSVQGREGFGNSEWRGSMSNTSGTGMGSSLGVGNDSSFDRIESEIRAAAGDRKTLVVFICDNAASQLVGRLADRASRMLKGAGSTSTVQQNLSAAVVSFGDEVKVLTPQPVGDAADLSKALNEVKGSSPAGKLAYKAVATAAETFGKYRKDHEVLFVMLAEDATADEESLKSAVASLKRDAIPVYAFGNAEPFYSKNLKAEAGKPLAASWAPGAHHGLHAGAFAGFGLCRQRLREFWVGTHLPFDRRQILPLARPFQHRLGDRS